MRRRGHAGAATDEFGTVPYAGSQNQTLAKKIRKLAGGEKNTWKDLFSSEISLLDEYPAPKPRSVEKASCCEGTGLVKLLQGDWIK